MILHKSSYHYHYQICVKKKMTIHIRDKCEERPIYKIYMENRHSKQKKKKKKMREFYRVFA